MLQASLARILGLIVGLAILGGVSHSPEQTPAGELPITVTAAAVTPNTCDPDTTCEGLEAEVQVLDGTVTEDCWWALRDAGYVGRPNDGPGGSEIEALYVPANELDAFCGDQGPACWIEHKTDLPDELIQGDPRLMPAGSTVVECGQA
jgi:hypothetical protein